MGRYEELGSGVNNVTKYLPFYAPGADAPSFIEDDMFTAVVPLVPTAGKVTAPVTASVSKLLGLLLNKGEMSNAEILGALSLKSRRRMRENYIAPALRAGLIEYTIPDKPNSRLQKYRLTEKGR